jgi:hypothetical protein
VNSAVAITAVFVYIQKFVLIAFFFNRIQPLEPNTDSQKRSTGDINDSELLPEKTLA